MNGEGFDDVIAGARRWSNPEEYEGGIFEYYPFEIPTVSALSLGSQLALALSLVLLGALALKWEVVDADFPSCRSVLHDP